MSALIDRINAPAPQKLTDGQKIRIDDFSCSMVENTLSNDGSLVEHNNLIGMHDGGNALCHDELRLARQPLGKRPTQGRIGFVVECREAVVEQ